MIPQWIIEKKRDGLELSSDEIAFFIREYNQQRIPDYQISALAMAIFFKGMTQAETSTLTVEMMNSGDLVDTSSIFLPKVDKHSTGGVGDKVSLVLAPLVACCGVAVPMISGRGLGITGGTLDKLESIPGYRSDLSPIEFVSVLQRCGCSIIGQTERLAPVDKRLYALRDVTGTVQSIPLITASIMSKKLAEGIDGLVLDVKCGKGAFMHSLEDARRLSESLIAVGRLMGKKMAALITQMDEPLGRSIGNTLEVIEAIRSLKGAGPPDLIELTIALAAQMLIVAGVTDDATKAESILRAKLSSGAAFTKFKEMVKLHGGDLSVIEDETRFNRAKFSRDLVSDRAGYIAEVDSDRIGRATLILGAGRTKADDKVDHAVGVENLVKVGEKIEIGQRLLTLWANNSDKLEQSLHIARGAMVLSEHPTAKPKLIMASYPID